MNKERDSLSASSRDDEALPLVTVIMPVRNEGPFIERSLGAVLAQDYPSQRLEVIVTDGNSTDDTRDIVRAIQQRSRSVTLIDNPRGIVPTGINTALLLAKGDVIVRVDGHTIVESDYVRECVAALNRSGADNVGGRMNAIGETRFAKAVALATSTPFGVGGARFHYSEGEEWVDTVYLGAWPRAVFDRTGGFDEELVRNQDDEFNYRLRSLGGRILLSSRIKSLYYNRGSLRSLWKQYFQYGYWKVRVMQKHMHMMRPRQFVPPSFAAALAGALILSMLSPLGKVVLLVIVGSYLLANLVASIQTSGRGAVSCIPLVSAAFVSIHLAYGVGFWFGFFRFLKRWSGTTTTIRFL